MPTPSSSEVRQHVSTADRPAEWLEDEFELHSMSDRSCTACGRTQTELQRAGHTLRFLCPDDVCTGCLGESAA